MTENLSAIWSGALISWRSSYTVSGIVLKRQTKDKRPQRSNVKEMNLLQKSLYILQLKEHLSFAWACSQKNTELYHNQPGKP